jgi:glycosyltransferase involved in cell wall biosynthesis
MPKLSIVTITLNNLAGLTRTRDSLAGLRDVDFEHLIIDGGSSDGTLDFLRALPAGSRWVSEPDRGPYDAMNKGAGIAQGEWVMFLNAGDTLAAPEGLATLLRAAEAADAGLAYGSHLYKGRIRRPEALETLHALLLAGEAKKWLRGHPCHQAVIARRRLLLDRPFDLRFRIAADFDWMESVRQSGVKSLKVDALICAYQPGGLSALNFPRCNAEWWKIAQLAGGHSKACRQFFLEAQRKHQRRKKRARWLARWKASRP